MSDPTHVVWHAHQITRDQRAQLYGHRSCVVWLTGLSGCGKSTIANLVDAQLFERRVHSFVLDGDNIRHGLNASQQLLAPDFGEAYAERFGLGFAPLDRQENIRRIAAVAQLFCSAGLVVLTAFVSPYRRDRQAARQQIERFGSPEDFVEVHVAAPLEVCEARDPKGLYRLARAGKISQFTGVDDPYEPPERPDLVLESSQQPADRLAGQLVALLEERGIIPAPGSQTISTREAATGPPES
jgi:adenylylsulfate kinase